MRVSNAMEKVATLVFPAQQCSKGSVFYLIVIAYYLDWRMGLRDWA
jgi:hypothetical protein